MKQSIKDVGSAKFNKRNLLISLIGFILFFIPVFFLDNLILSGIFCVLGLSIILFIWRTAKSRLEFIICTLLFYFAHVFRFIHILERNPLNISLICTVFIPFTLLILVSIFFERQILKTKHGYLGVLVTPIIYGGISLLLAVFSLGFVSNIMTYLMIIPCYTISLSFLTEYGMTFFFMLIISLISYIFILKPNLIKKVFICLSSVLVVVPIVIGSIQLLTYKEPDFTLHIALGICQYGAYDESDDEIYDFNQYMNLLENQLKTSKENNADLLLLHEEYFDCLYSEEDKFINGISSLVKKYNIPLLAGIEVLELDNGYDKDSIIYFDQDGNVLFEYVKHNLVPIIDDGYMSGDGAPAYIKTNIGGYDINLSAVICFDINDETYLRSINEDTELLLAPSWDWYNCNNEQIKTWIRSCALNTTIVKHTYEGFSYVSTPNGIKTQQVDTRKQYKQVFFVEAPIYKK